MLQFLLHKKPSQTYSMYNGYWWNKLEDCLDCSYMPKFRENIQYGVSIHLFMDMNYENMGSIPWSLNVRYKLFVKI